MIENDEILICISILLIIRIVSYKYAQNKKYEDPNTFSIMICIPCAMILMGLVGFTMFII